MAASTPISGISTKSRRTIHDGCEKLMAEALSNVRASQEFRASGAVSSCCFGRWR